MSPVTVLPVGAPLEEITSVLERDGVVIIKDFLPASTIKQMNESLKPYIEASTLEGVGEVIPEGFGDGAGELLEGNTYRIYGLLGKMPEQVIEILRHDVWKGIGERLLSDERTEFIGDEEITLKSGYKMSLAQSFTIMAGCKKQKLHRDQSKMRITGI
jgi:hypothetical protein